MLAHLLADMWQRAGPATSFSLACVLLKRYAALPRHAMLPTQQPSQLALDAALERF